MKARQYINMVGMAAAVLLSSCVKDTLYDTPHPDYGKIAVTADWSACGEGINIPATWTVTMGDYTGTETSATHAPDHLFTPGSYTLAVWNPAEGITVNGTTATIAAATGNRAGTDAFVNNAPGWFFTYTKQMSIAFQLFQVAGEGGLCQFEAFAVQLLQQFFLRTDLLA